MAEPALSARIVIAPGANTHASVAAPTVQPGFHSLAAIGQMDDCESGARFFFGILVRFTLLAHKCKHEKRMYYAIGHGHREHRARS